MEENQDNIIDKVLLERFEEEIWNKVPHLENNEEGSKIVNATPLVDITSDFKECAKEIYKLDLSNSELQVYGKLDSTLLTGSIKVRPAANIIHNAIMTGKIKSGQTVIEATSGNFGIALGMLSKLGLQVVTIVSRKLQEGVFHELRNMNIKIMDLEMDICPAPGMEGKKDELVAKATDRKSTRLNSSHLAISYAVFC